MQPAHRCVASFRIIGRHMPIGMLRDMLSISSINGFSCAASETIAPQHVMHESNHAPQNRARRPSSGAAGPGVSASRYASRRSARWLTL